MAAFDRHARRFDEMEVAMRNATAQKMNRPDLLMSAAELPINRGRDLPEAKELLRRYVSSSGKVEDASVFKGHCLLG